MKLTLFQRQQIFVRAAERLYRRQWRRAEYLNIAVRDLMLFNAKRMVFAGYTKAEADASFRQCCDMAKLNLICDQVPA